MTDFRLEFLNLGSGAGRSGASDGVEQSHVYPAAEHTGLLGVLAEEEVTISPSNAQYVKIIALSGSGYFRIGKTDITNLTGSLIREGESIVVSCPPLSPIGLLGT